jgi:hypothetical protein
MTTPTAPVEYGRVQTARYEGHLVTLKLWLPGYQIHGNLYALVERAGHPELEELLEADDAYQHEGRAFVILGEAGLVDEPAEQFGRRVLKFQKEYDLREAARLTRLFRAKQRYGTLDALAAQVEVLRQRGLN